MRWIRAVSLRFGGESGKQIQTVQRVQASDSISNHERPNNERRLFYFQREYAGYNLQIPNRSPVPPYYFTAVQSNFRNSIGVSGWCRDSAGFGCGLFNLFLSLTL